MPALGAYHLDLICDSASPKREMEHWDSDISSPTMFIEPTKGEAKREARLAGWVLLRPSQCLCPIHATEAKQLRAQHARSPLPKTDIPEDKNSL